MRGEAPGEQGHDVASPETATNRRSVVGAIPEHAVGPLPRSSPGGVQWGNRIHQREGFLRVVPIRAGETHRERHAPPVADQMALAPALGPIGGIRTRLVPAVHRADGTAVDNRPRPINLVIACEPIQ